MFIHTHKTVSKLFNRNIDNISELRPINLWGPSGLGKLFYIKEFIRHIQCKEYKPFIAIEDIYQRRCNCRICRNIISDNAADILTLESNENIEKIRDKFNDFIDSTPVEWRYKFLIVQNLQRFNNRELDIFLNIFEEPPDHIKIFTTSTDLEGIPYAIKSRLFSFKVNPFKKEDLKIILKVNSELETYLSTVDRYKFNTIDQLIMYNKFTFEDIFLNIFSKVDGSYGIEKKMNYLFNLIEIQKEFQMSEVLKFFLDFSIARLDEFFELNAGEKKIHILKEVVLNKILNIFSESLFKYINGPRNYNINIKNQIFTLFNLIFMVRKLLEV